jgi:hypothetical protein
LPRSGAHIEDRITGRAALYHRAQKLPVPKQGGSLIMKILQFKHGGEYQYNVAFETSFEKRKIQTNDEPENALMESAAIAVSAAVSFFCFENVNARFRQISFSYPDGESDSFVLEMDIKAEGNPYITHAVKSQKIKLVPVTVGAGSSSEFSRNIQRENSLIAAVDMLRDRIAEYAAGARSQKDLPFDEDERGDTASEGGGLFSGSEGGE